MTGASIVDEVPAGEDGLVDHRYVKAHTFVVVDLTTPEGKVKGARTHRMVLSVRLYRCVQSSQKVTVNIPTSPAHQSAIVEILSR